MTSPSSGSRNEPLQYALKLLNIRGRSIRELSFRLKRKGFSEKEIEDTISYLLERGFLDDRILARELISYCQDVKGYGVRGVREFLKKRGIENHIIEEMTSEIQEDVNTALKIARRYYEHNRQKPSDVLRRRLYGYLYRRGYSHSTVHEVLKRLHLL